MKKKIKKKNINSLYIHIPFCDHICNYCDFTKFLKNEIFIEKYVLNLLNDLKNIKSYYNKFKTIYIGGGTPSILSLNQLERILSIIKPLLSKNCEYTIEVNPESINEDKLKLFKNYGINRISIGIQSFNTNLLKIINRDYGIDYFNLIEIVKKYFSNINIDLIYGLPNENMNELSIDLENFIKLDINHISIYSLIIDQGSIFHNQKLKEEDNDKLRDEYDLIVKTLEKHGLNRYEVSNFSKKGYESKHNLNYWYDDEYVAIGVGSSGYEGNLRYINSKSLTNYLKGLRSREEELITKEEDEKYFLMTNLRLEKGFSLKEYKKRYGKDFYIEKKNIIDKLLNQKLVILNKNRFKIAKNALYILDSILVDLF